MSSKVIHLWKYVTWRGKYAYIENIRIDGVQIDELDKRVIFDEEREAIYKYIDNGISFMDVDLFNIYVKTFTESLKKIFPNDFKNDVIVFMSDPKLNTGNAILKSINGKLFI